MPARMTARHTGAAPAIQRATPGAGAMTPSKPRSRGRAAPTPHRGAASPRRCRRASSARRRRRARPLAGASGAARWRASRMSCAGLVLEGMTPGSKSKRLTGEEEEEVSSATATFERWAATSFQATPGRAPDPRARGARVSNACSRVSSLSEK
jgi:hypothetical protein